MYKQTVRKISRFNGNLFPTNLLFSSSFSSAELAALDISGGVPRRHDDEALNRESPELQPCGIVGTRKYLKQNTAIKIPNKHENLSVDEIPRQLAVVR